MIIFGLSRTYSISIQTNSGTIIPHIPYNTVTAEVFLVLLMAAVEGKQKGLDGNDLMKYVRDNCLTLLDAYNRVSRQGG